jgi:hypothetical protein
MPEGTDTGVYIIRPWSWIAGEPDPGICIYGPGTGQLKGEILELVFIFLVQDS